MMNQHLRILHLLGFPNRAPFGALKLSLLTNSIFHLFEGWQPRRKGLPRLLWRLLYIWDRIRVMMKIQILS
jgi:hypothetical protein